MSNSQLEPLLAGEPEAVQAEILTINDDGARPLPARSPYSSRSLASLLGVLNAVRMRRLP